MQTLTLTRRKTQLELLERACQKAAPAALAVRAAPTERAPAKTQLLGLEPDGLWVSWPESYLAGEEFSGTRVRVTFELRGGRFAFNVETQGCHTRPVGVHGPQKVLKLSVPLAIDEHTRQDRRRERRITSEGCGDLEARLVHATNKRIEHRLDVVDLSLGGVGGTVDDATAVQLDRGALYWIDIRLPGRTEVISFVARLVHMAPAESPGVMLTGWAYCPGDDGSDYRRKLDRLAEFLDESAARLAE